MSRVPNTREKNLNEKTLDWYETADAKGRLLLNLDGVFITVRANGDRRRTAGPRPGD